MLPSRQVDEIVVHRPSPREQYEEPLPPEAPAVGEVRREQVWEVPPVPLNDNDTKPGGFSEPCFLAADFSATWRREIPEGLVPPGSTPIRT